MITRQELDELELQAERAVTMTGAFNDAVKAVAEKHEINGPALRQYIMAKVRDTLEALERKQDTLHQLQMFENNGYPSE